MCLCSDADPVTSKLEGVFNTSLHNDGRLVFFVFNYVTLDVGPTANLQLQMYCVPHQVHCTNTMWTVCINCNCNVIVILKLFYDL